MNLPQVLIETGRAEIGRQYSKPQMSISQRNAVMSVDQDLAGRLHISTTASKLFIDQAEAFADADLKSPLRRVKENAAKGMQNISQYVAKTAREGEQLKRIENGGNALAQIARQNGERQLPEVGQGTIPGNAFKVKFDYTPSEVSVNVEWPDPNIQFQTFEPEIHIPRWETSAYLKQKEWINFTVVGANVNQQL
ncbi:MULTISPECIES: DUF6470 family protein [Bacillaceae]|uniref:Uncharacterized protein n=1 Tax=Evansella alkalicola TaxID=745819 RepID=A0ABS6JT33_9BACI|nr:MULTISPECIES: DUF6470 family protein [Bacillaceae]MBU9721727.1 hypothetical protein [Bacillus alkalicola]